MTMRHFTLARRAFGPYLFALLIALTAAASARAQAETWIQATPARVVPAQLSVFTCGGLTNANVRWVFPDGGYRVVQTPTVSRTGQTITLDVRAEEWTGGRTLALVPFDKNFELGSLEPGTYTLDVRS